MFKWLGGALGWASGGILGGILGFAIGSAVENMYDAAKNEGSSGGSAFGTGGFGSAGNSYGSGSYSYGSAAGTSTAPNDFGASLLVLSAAVMKSDNRLMKSELNYVRTFFTNQFGQEKADRYIIMFRDLLKQEYDLNSVCMQIRMNMSYSSRLQLLHYLFGLAKSDGAIHEKELEIINVIANGLSISMSDFQSVKNMFIKNESSSYKILGITPEATDEEVKKAYKKMAIKYHPDKVSHLGEDVQKAATEKFKEVNRAYDNIKKERGMN